MSERGTGEKSFGVIRVLRDRLRAISAESGVAIEHVLFMVAIENDDLSVHLDPDYTLRFTGFLSAMQDSAVYWKMQRDVRGVLQELRAFGLGADIGLNRDRCLRCGTPHPDGKGAPPAAD